MVEHLTFNQRVSGSSPLWLTIILNIAGVAELADALDLGSSALRRGGSTPFTRICRSSSAVEYDLAKVGVAGSNPVFCSIIFAGVAELADAQDLKSCGERSPYRFDSGPRHHHFNNAPVAQLDRVLDYESRGYRFDPCRAHYFTGSSSAW